MIEIDSSMGRHSRYLRLAHKIAHKSNFPKYRMGCVVVKSGRVLTFGINKLGGGFSKHPAYKNKAVHAELAAVMTLDKEVLQNSTIYVSGFSKGNNLICSAPCESCQQMLKEFGVKAVMYHEKNGQINEWRVS